LKKDAEMYAGCVSGAIIKSDYLKIIQTQRFNSIKIHKQKEILIPDSILCRNLNKNEIIKFKESDAKILSITVTAKK